MDLCRNDGIAAPFRHGRRETPQGRAWESGHRVWESGPRARDLAPSARDRDRTTWEGGPTACDRGPRPRDLAPTACDCEHFVGAHETSGCDAAAPPTKCRVEQARSGGVRGVARRRRRRCSSRRGFRLAEATRGRAYGKPPVRGLDASTATSIPERRLRAPSVPVGTVATWLLSKARVPLVWCEGRVGTGAHARPASSRVRVARLARNPRREAASFGAPSMGINLEVKVLSEIDHSDRSEPQGRDREEPSGGSGERSRGPTYRNRI